MVEFIGSKCKNKTYKEALFCWHLLEVGLKSVIIPYFALREVCILRCVTIFALYSRVTQMNSLIKVFSGEGLTAEAEVALSTRAKVNAITVKSMRIYKEISTMFTCRTKLQEG